MVDEIDDLEVTRQDPPQHLDWPSLERFRHQGVVGVAEAAAAEFPGEIPLEALHVEEKPHQLRNGKRRMRVVEMDRRFVCELGKIVLAQVPLQQVL